MIYLELLTEPHHHNDINGHIHSDDDHDHHQDFVSSPDYGDREKTPGALTYSERIARKFMESDTVIIIVIIIMYM